MSDMCHNGHPFEPGVDIDMAAEGRSPDTRWCNVCGEMAEWEAERDAALGDTAELALYAAHTTWSCGHRTRLERTGRRTTPGRWPTVAEPGKSRRRRTTIICEPDYRPGTRDECPNPLHDHPLPDGYIAASDVAAARLRRGWANPRCPDCGLYGWRRGRPLGEPYEPAAMSRG